jgi:hypothetical protein
MNTHLNSESKVEAVKRYLKRKYNITMSNEAVKERIKMIEMNYELK